MVEKARAVSPDLIAALQAFGDRALAEKMAESMAPLAILGGESVAEVLARLLRGSPLARLLPGAANEAGQVLSARPRRRAPWVGCGDRGSGVAVPRRPGQWRREA